MKLFVFTCLASIAFLIADSQEKNIFFEGKVVYVKSSVAAGRKLSGLDTSYAFFRDNTIKISYKIYGPTETRIVDRIMKIVNDTAFDFWIDHKHKIILKQAIENEYPERNFKSLNTYVHLRGNASSGYLSDMRTRGQNEYIIEIWTNNNMLFNVKPAFNNYLINFRVHEGKIILDQSGVYYFNNSNDASKSSTSFSHEHAVIVEQRHLPESTFEFPSGYKIEPYSESRLNELFFYVELKDALENLDLRGN